MTSHATHISIPTLGDDLNTDDVWQTTPTSISTQDPCREPETPRAPLRLEPRSANGRSKYRDAHPLSPHSPAFITGDGLTEGMPTRPSLQRVLEGSFGLDATGDAAGLGGRRSRKNTVVSNSSWEDLSGSSELGEGSSIPDDASEGKQMLEGVEVIVHEILPTDSLAGVALKYNIPLATLRRTNKLWASDSVHLRRTLYIPLPKQPARPPLPHSISVSTVPASTSPTLLTTEDRSTSTPSLTACDSAATLRASSRRIVPADELSFFPPPRTGTALGEIPSPNPNPNVMNDNAGRRHARTASVAMLLPASLDPSPSGSPRPHTLIDLFRAMPDVSAMGRRSLDSLSVGSVREEVEEVAVEMEMGERTERRLNEPMKPSPGMIIQRGGARGDEAEHDEDWI